MNSLREEIRRRRAEEGFVPNPFYGTNDRVTGLRVEDSDGELWVLPWNHFIAGRHDWVGSRERLVLTFVAHEITIRGLKLGELLLEVASQHLEWLRAVPGKYLKSAPDEPAIEELRVRSLAEPVVTE